MHSIPRTIGPDLYHNGIIVLHSAPPVYEGTAPLSQNPPLERALASIAGTLRIGTLHGLVSPSPPLQACLTIKCE